MAAHPVWHAQRMKLLDDIKAFVTKNHILVIALGVVLGLAIKEFISVAIMGSVIVPLLNMIVAGKGFTNVLDFRYFQLGTLLLQVIELALTVGAAYFIYCFLTNCSSTDRKESAPPPPPAPPV